MGQEGKTPALREMHAPLSGRKGDAEYPLSLPLQLHLGSSGPTLSSLAVPSCTQFPISTMLSDNFDTCFYHTAWKAFPSLLCLGDFH